MPRSEIWLFFASDSVWKLANVQVFEEELAPVVLKLNLIGPRKWRGSRFVPVVLKDGAVDDQLTVEPDRNAISDHANQKCIPLSWLFVGVGERAVAGLAVVPEAAGSKVSPGAIRSDPVLGG